MSVHVEQVNTVHPFFTVEKIRGKQLRELDPDAVKGQQALSISGDDVWLVGGNLEEFALKVVLAVYGTKAKVVLID